MKIFTHSKRENGTEKPPLVAHIPEILDGPILTRLRHFRVELLRESDRINRALSENSIDIEKLERDPQLEHTIVRAKIILDGLEAKKILEDLAANRGK